MIKNLILLLAVVYAYNTLAQVDYDVEANFRSYPLGASVKAKTGYAFKIWEKDEFNKVFYGYVRPAASFESSSLTHTVAAQLDFYPVSFFGMYIGKAKGWRNLTDLQGFTCSEINCGAESDRDFWGVNLALGYNGVTLVNFYKSVDLDYDTKDTLIAEEFSNMEVADEDKMKINTTLVAYNIDKDTMLGILNLYSKSYVTNQDTTMTMILGSKKIKKITYQVGAGIFETRDDHQHPSILIGAKWTGEKGLRLF
jgi:hypothetical protein